MSITALLCLFLATSVLSQDYRGVWWWTWTGGLTNLDRSKTNLAIAFSGWTDPASAIRDSTNILGQLPGTKFISLGGGNANGRWGTADVPKVETACRNRQFAGYAGIAFDIEEGDSGLNFGSCFATCKANGYQVMVTSSHSAPYGVPDAARLMRSFFKDPNVDFISPQMYTTGTEGGNDFATTGGVAWTEYANLRAKIVPAIVTGSYYNSLKSQFATYGVTTVGYVQWSQTMTYPSGTSPVAPVPVSAPTTGGGSVPCGSGSCPAGQCCSQYGYCGTTAEYCGAGCTAGCPTPAPRPVAPAPRPVAPTPSAGTYCVNSGKVCDPGYCCSQWGWCGQGPSFCGGARLEEGSEKQDGSDGLGTGPIVAIVVCSVLVAAIIVGGALFVLLRKKSDNSERF